MSRPPLCRPRPVALVTLLAGILDCGVVEESIPLDVPVSSEDRSVVLFLSEPMAEHPVAAHAMDVAQARVSPRVLWTDRRPESEGVDLEVAALFYPRTLEDLGIPSGELPLQVSASKRTLPLPPPSRLATASIRGRTPSEFSETRQTPRVIETFQIEDQRLIPECAAFEDRVVGLGSSDDIHFLLGLGHGVLLTTGGRETFFVTLEEGARRIDGPPLRLFDAYTTDSDEIWLSGEGGQILKGRLVPEGCTTRGAVPCGGLETVGVTTTPSREDLFWIAGPPTGVVDEIFTLSYRGTLEHVDLVEGTAKAYRRFMTFDPRTRGGVAWVRRGEAVAVLSENDAFVRWRDGAAVEEMSPPVGGLDIESGGFTAALRLPGGGTLIGSWTGNFYQNDSGRAEGWTWLGAQIFREYINAMAPYETGFLYVDGMSRLGQYLPRAEPSPFCEAYQPEPIHFTDYRASAGRDLAIVGRDVVVSSAPRDRQTAENYVRWFVRR